MANDNVRAEDSRCAGPDEIVPASEVEASDASARMLGSVMLIAFGLIVGFVVGTFAW